MTEIDITQDLGEFGLSDPNGTVKQNCKKCNNPINEGHAYELGDDRWHIDCFKCSKCDNSLGCNSNFLVLGNGNLICSKCSYNCKQCGKKIDDLAILTGDQAYCSNCFKCRSCKMKIEDLRYARTSKGLFCMDCHEKLMAKKKKYDAKKKQLALIQQQNEVREEREREQERELLREREREQREAAPVAGIALDALRTGNSSRNSFLNSYLSSDSTTHLESVGINGNSSNTGINGNSSNTGINGNSSNTGIDLLANPSTGSILTPNPPTVNTLAGNSLFLHANHSNSSVVSKNKILPARPLAATPPQVAPYSQLEPKDSFNSSRTDLSVGGGSQVSTATLESPGSFIHIGERFPIQDNDFSIEEVINYSDDEDTVSQRNTSLRPQRLPQQSFQRKSLASPQSSLASTPTQAQIPNERRSACSPGLNETNLPASSPGLLLSQYSTPPISSDATNSKEAYHDSVDSHTPPNLNVGDSLQPPVVLTPKTSLHPSENWSQNKNLLIVSPNQFHDNEFHNTTTSIKSSSPQKPSSRESQITTSSHDIKPTTLSAPMDDSRVRSSCPSPFAKANRQARVVETNDYVSTENLNEIESQREDGFVTTPRKKGNSTMSISSPPPRLPPPRTPSKKSFNTGTPSSNDTRYGEEGTPRGLGLEGIMYKEATAHNRDQHASPRSGAATPSQQISPEFSHQTPTSMGRRIIGNVTPAVTNLEDPEKQPEPALSRRSTVSRTPILNSSKHKRSISGGSAINKFNIFKSKDDSARHSRTASEGSISAGSAFTTPPLPMATPQVQPYSSSFAKEHYRSTSDTPFLTNLDSHNTGVDAFDIKSIKSEINQLGSQRQSLDVDVKRLRAQKHVFSEQLKSIQTKINEETANYNNLLKDVAEFESNKKKLLDINQSLSEQNQNLSEQNQSLSEQNHDLELSLGTSQTSLHNFGSNEITEYSDSSTFNTSKNNTSLPYSQPYSEFNEESSETNKATRLKFWRRPKIGTLVPNIVSTNQLTTSAPPLPPQLRTTSSNGNNKISQSYSSQAIHLPQQSQNNYSSNNSNNYSSNNSNNLSLAKPSANSKGKFTKSRSTNILDTFLTGTGDSQKEDVPLFSSTIQKRSDFEQSNFPMIVKICLQEVESRGLDVEGIYRISGGNSAIVAIENGFSNLPAFPDDKQIYKLQEIIDGDINAVTSALKRYLRKLPDPLIPYSLYDSFIRVSSSNAQNKLEKRIHDLRVNVIQQLPPANRTTLHVLVKHLDLVSSYSNVNRMGFKNLSVVFAPTIALDETGQKEMIDMGFRNDVTELLLNHYERVFE